MNNVESFLSKKSGHLPQGVLRHSPSPCNLYLFESVLTARRGAEPFQYNKLDTLKQMIHLCPCAAMRKCDTVCLSSLHTWEVFQNVFLYVFHCSRRYRKCFATESDARRRCNPDVSVRKQSAKIALQPLHSYAYSILIQRTCHSPPCDTNKLEPPQVLDADLHFVSSSLVRRQHNHKKLCSPDMEALIETVGRVEALAVCSLYRELISWRDLCALFQVCRVSQGATHHSAQSRLLHIWSGSVRVTCTHAQTHTCTCKCWRRGEHKHPPVHKDYRMPECVMSWLIMHALCRQSSVDEPH